MGYATIFYNNLVTSSNVSASSEATAFPASFLYDTNQGTVWNSNAGTSIIDIDAGATNTVTGLFLYNTNIVSGDTLYSWEAGNDPTFATSSYSVVLTIKADHFQSHNNLFNVPGTALTNLRYHRVAFIKASGNATVGQIYLAGSQLVVNDKGMSGDFDIQKFINGNKVPTGGGHIYHTINSKKYIMNGKFYSSETQKNALLDILDSEYTVFWPYGVEAANNTLNMYGITEMGPNGVIQGTWDDTTNQINATKGNSYRSDFIFTECPA